MSDHEQRIASLCDDLDLQKFILQDLVDNRPGDNLGIQEAADQVKNLEAEIASLLAPPTSTSRTVSPIASIDSLDRGDDFTASGSRSRTPDVSILSPQQSPFNISNEDSEKETYTTRKRAREETVSPQVETQRVRLNEMMDMTSYREREETASPTPDTDLGNWDGDYDFHPSIQKIDKELKLQLVELRANFADLREPENVALTMKEEEQTAEEVLESLREEQLESERVVQARFQIAKDKAIARLLQERPDSEDEDQPVLYPQLERPPTQFQIPVLSIPERMRMPYMGVPIGNTPNHFNSRHSGDIVDLTDDSFYPGTAGPQPIYQPPQAVTEAQAFQRLVQAMDGDQDGDVGYSQYESQKFPADIKALLEGITDIRKAMEHDHEIPPTLSVKLMKHQRIGLAWMKAKEHSSHRGGVLGDDMGLGKTIQAIALMAALPATKPKDYPSLIVCPKALMDQWKRELTRHMKTGYHFSVLVFHDKTRNTPWNDIKRYDIVITTFGTLVAHHKAIAKSEEMRLAHRPESEYKKVREQAYMYGPKAKWHRIIVDEAQNIKNPATKAAKACGGINASYRWCLTGTPMMNGLKDYGSLIHFLKIRPYCHTEVFNRNFVGKNPSETVMKQMRILIKSTCLRRTKASKLDGEPILVLPLKHIETHHAVPGEHEKEFYKLLSDESTNKVQKLIERGVLGKNYSMVLVLILRLRQACCHPLLLKELEYQTHVLGLDEVDLQKNAELLSPTVVKRLSESEDTISFTCSVCMDIANNYIIYTPCGHSTCTECFVQISDPAMLARTSDDGTDVMKCQTCRGPVNPKMVTDANTFKDIHMNSGKKVDKVEEKAKKSKKKERATNLEDIWVPSAKTDKAMEILQKIEQEGKGEKTLVFSQFTSMLDLLEIPIKRDGLEYVRFDGTMNNEARNQAIQTFTDNPECRVFLISMKAGNAGLNLTMANHVIMFDPFWNPYVELQAIDRCYRIGQTKEVFVHRILIAETIEDRIIELQERKMEIIEGALTEGGKYEVSSLSQREMAGLFGIKPTHF